MLLSDLLYVLQLAIQGTPFKRCIFVWYVTQNSIESNELLLDLARRQDNNHFHLLSCFG